VARIRSGLERLLATMDDRGKVERLLFSLFSLLDEIPPPPVTGPTPPAPAEPRNRLSDSRDLSRSMVPALLPLPLTSGL
jgi:hypothetical protein